MFNKKSSKQANQDDERAKVPNFGDQKIDEARGKSLQSHQHNLTLRVQASWSRSVARPT